jgi:hypothetical protein
MTQAQVKYARQRAEQIYGTKRQAIERAHTTEAVTLTTEEKIAAIKADRIEVNNSSQSSYWAYNIKFIDERPKTVRLDQAQPEITKLKQDFDKLMDELMLGDNEEALALLKAFEAL